VKFTKIKNKNLNGMIYYEHKCFKDNSDKVGYIAEKKPGEWVFIVYSYNPSFSAKELQQIANRITWIEAGEHNDKT
jgi:hypothetical protein